MNKFLEEKTIKIKEILNLKDEPVGVLFSNISSNSGENSKEFVCRGILKASKGEIINFSAKNTLCEIGRYFLGFGDRPKDDEENLVKRDKIFCSLSVARSFYVNTPSPPKGLAKYVIISPLSSMENNPDLILFITNPYQVSQILGILAYSKGALPKLFSFGPTCQNAISSPLVCNQLNVSFIDLSSRREAGFKKEEMIVSLPFYDFIELIENSKYSCFAKSL